jgi:hypothetical protein
MELEERIENIMGERDAGGLIDLIHELDASQLIAHKDDLIDAGMGLFYEWLLDLQLEKIDRVYHEAAIASLFNLQEAIEKVAPEHPRHVMRAELHRQRCELKDVKEEKLVHLQHAIDEYQAGIKVAPTAEKLTGLADMLLDKMEISQVHPAQDLTAILQLFQDAFVTWSDTVLGAFLHGSFRLLEFPFEERDSWYNKFLEHLENRLRQFATEDVYVYLEYSRRLLRALNDTSYNLSDAQKEALAMKVVSLLDGLKNYETDDVEQLNQLGQAFEKITLFINKDQRLPYYEAALAYFKKEQSVRPASWTFPVYATNLLKAMAGLYEHDHARMKMFFEEGRALFEITGKYDDGFTLTLYWGKFLIAYAKAVYNFEASEILKEAEEQALRAKELGNGYYDQPFHMLAKIALKRGDREWCMEVLRECKALFSTAYYEYDGRAVREDEDLREVWELL